MRALVLAALVSLSLLTGCVSGGTAPDYQVRIDEVVGNNSLGYGHGVLIDSRTVVTVAHVGKASEEGSEFYVSRAASHVNNGGKVRYIRARRVVSFNDRDSAEALVVFTLDKSMSADVYPKFRNVAKGDSGSPILGARGEVVGLVSGVQMVPFLGDFRIRGPSVVGTNGPFGPVPRKRRKESE